MSVKKKIKKIEYWASKCDKCIWTSEGSWNETEDEVWFGTSVEAKEALDNHIARYHTVCYNPSGIYLNSGSEVCCELHNGHSTKKHQLKRGNVTITWE